MVASTSSPSFSSSTLGKVRRDSNSYKKRTMLMPLTSRRQSRDAVIVAAGKKKKRTGSSEGKNGGGASSSSSSSSSSVPSVQPARRITGKSNGMSVSTQLKLVERFRSLNVDGSSSSSPVNKSSSTSSKPIDGVRRASTPRDRAYEQELARRRLEKKKEARLASELRAHSGAGSPPLLLVDGYNICGLEECGLEEANAAFKCGDLDAARETLVKEVKDFKAFSGYDVVLVWDADRNREKDEDDVEGDLATDGFQIVYSVKNDADSWIEARVVEELKGVGGGVSKQRRVVYVATSDGALSSIVRGSGAYVVTAPSFVEELRKATQGEKEILEEMLISARWSSAKKMSTVGVKDDDVKRKLLEMYKSAPSMEMPANAPKGDFRRQSETTKSKSAPSAPKWVNMRAQRRRDDAGDGF